MIMASRPTTHFGVKAGIEVLAGRAIRSQSKQYAEDVAPLIEAVRKAQSPEAMRRLMSAALAKRMGTKALTKAMGETMLQADLIARAEAAPKPSKDADL